MIHLLATNLDNYFSFQLPHGFIPTETQLRSTSCDNLIEFAGRVCYDSLGSAKSRNTKDYFAHIHEAKHTSILEHVVLTFEMEFGKKSYAIDYQKSLINRPGIFSQIICRSYDNPAVLSVTLNARAALELPNSTALKHAFHEFAPLAVPDVDAAYEHSLEIKFNRVLPQSPHEIYYSFYLSGISRNLTHELVRHRYEAGISQRSTRYVDEDESSVAWHPMMLANMDEINSMLENEALANNLNDYMAKAVVAYESAKAIIESNLIARGVDKFTARKQARGAARGLLPSALSTECVFTASEYEWAHIIRSRSNNGADAEIRLLTNEIFDILRSRGLFPNAIKTVAKDGIGYEINL